MKRITTIIVGVVALGLGATTYAAVLRHGSGSLTVGNRPVIAVTAQVSGLLYPGSVRPVKLRIRNLSGRRLTLLAVNVKAGRPSGQCPATAITGSHVVLRGTLARRGTRTVWASLRMRATSPDSCEGAEIPLSFAVTLGGHS